MAVFYSFHYDRDVSRVHLIKNMGVVEGQRILNSQEWESVQRQGATAIRNWIDEQMKYKTAVVVLIGAQTASRPWVRYEILQAWEEKRPLVGVRIHGLKDFNGSTDTRGPNPFEIEDNRGNLLSTWVPAYDPLGRDSQTVYASIRTNLSKWVASAYKCP